MARSAAARGKRKKPDARREQRRPGRSAPVEGHELFFSRIRRQAKWMFVLLVVVFAAGFVLYGVGTGYGGLQDLLTFNQGGGKNASIEKLRKEIQIHPGNAKAYLDLAHALRRDERLEEAIEPLEQYTRLRPKDSDALQELAGLYLERARRYADELNAINAELLSVPGGGFELPPGSFLAKEVEKDPFYKNVITELSKRRSEAAVKLNSALTSRADAYKRAANALPASDTRLPGLVFAWAQASEQAQDFQTAIKAYKRYLKLAPDSGLAPDARRAIKRLQQYLKGQQASSSGGG